MLRGLVRALGGSGWSGPAASDEGGLFGRPDEVSPRTALKPCGGPRGSPRRGSGVASIEAIRVSCSGAANVQGFPTVDTDLRVPGPVIDPCDGHGAPINSACGPRGAAAYGAACGAVEDFEPIPQAEQTADELLPSRAQHVVDGQLYYGVVEWIVRDALSRAKLYRIRYRDGAVDYWTEAQVRGRAVRLTPSSALPFGRGRVAGGRRHVDPEWQPESNASESEPGEEGDHVGRCGVESSCDVLSLDSSPRGPKRDERGVSPGPPVAEDSISPTHGKNPGAALEPVVGGRGSGGSEREEVSSDDGRSHRPYSFDAALLQLDAMEYASKAFDAERNKARGEIDLRRFPAVVTTEVLRQNRYAALPADFKRGIADNVRDVLSVCQ